MSRKLFYATHTHDLGRFTLAATERGLCALRLPGPGEGQFLRRLVEELDAVPERAPQRMAHAIAQLDEYLAGHRRDFDLDLDLDAGTEFQRRVWKVLLSIPYGRTLTYGEVAQAMRRPRAARAVGLACGANPVAIVVPCHRVLAQGDALGGYSAGLGWKKRFLQLENAAAVACPSAPQTR